VAKSIRVKNADARHWGGIACSSDEVAVMAMEQRGYIRWFI
jgi:hypothetical protein